MIQSGRLGRQEGVVEEHLSTASNGDRPPPSTNRRALTALLGPGLHGYDAGRLQISSPAAGRDGAAIITADVDSSSPRVSRVIRHSDAIT